MKTEHSMKRLGAILALMAAMLFGALAAPASAAMQADPASAAVPAVMLLAQAAPAADAPAAPAADAPAAEEPTLNSGDTAWMLTSTLLVILMTIPGLALFYGGLARSKNMLSVLMHVMAVFALITLLWSIYGYSLAFSNGGSFYGDFGKLFLKGITPDTLSGTIPEYVFVAFQSTFAAITCALIVGSFAERIEEMLEVRELARQFHAESSYAHLPFSERKFTTRLRVGC